MIIYVIKEHSITNNIGYIWSLGGGVSGDFLMCICELKMFSEVKKSTRNILADA